MFSCHTLTDFNARPDLRNAWTSLLEQSEYPHVQGSFGFCRAWWKAAQDRYHLHLMTVCDEDDRIRLLAPFCARKDRPNYWEPVGVGSSDYHSLLHIKGDNAPLEFFLGWIRRRQFWRRMEISDLPLPNSLVTRVPRPLHHAPGLGTKLKALFRPYPLAFVAFNDSHPVISRERLRTFSDILQGRHYRKPMNWFKRQGELTFSTEHDPNVIKEALPDFITLHSSDWRQRGFPSAFEGEESRKFLKALCLDPDINHSLRLDRLKLNGTTIAAHLGFCWKRKIYWYLTCMDHAYADHSPGKLLIGHVLANCGASGVVSLDLLRGREGYKDHLASEIRATANIIFFSSRWEVLSHWAARKGRW